MHPLGQVVGATLAISLVAWIGLFTLFVRRDLLDTIVLGLVALAAGTLIGGAFFHLIPNALAGSGSEGTLEPFVYVVTGFCAFYVLEEFIHWHHHHGSTHEHEPVSYLVLLSDAVHNVIDGLVVAGAFLSSVSLGLVTTLVIGLHEIPQEIGNFGVLVHGGYDRRQALLLNYLAQSTVVLGGVAGVLLSDVVTGLSTFVLPFAAGSFVYIASSDLIPEIKGDESRIRSVLYFLVFLLGVGLMLGVRLLRSSLG